MQGGLIFASERWIKSYKGIREAYIATFAFAFAFGFMAVSEYDKYNPNLKWLYIPTHCIWHIMIFLYLEKIYKP